MKRYIKSASPMTLKQFRGHIDKAKQGLIKQAKRGGLRENFGDTERRKLRDMIPISPDGMNQPDWVAMQNEMRSFDDWASNFDLSYIRDSSDIQAADYNYINLDEDIDELIENFEPYIQDIQEDMKLSGQGIGYAFVQIGDRNSDFSEWVDASINKEYGMDTWEWNRQVFFDRSYTDDMNIKRILEDETVNRKVDDILYEEFGAY